MNHRELLNNLSNYRPEGVTAYIWASVIGATIFGSLTALVLRHTRTQPTQEYLTGEERVIVGKAIIAGAIVGTLLYTVFPN